MTQRIVAWDTETALIGNDPVLGWQGQTPAFVCLSYKIGSQAPKITAHEQEAGALIRNWITCPDTIMVGQNIPYDLMQAVVNLEIPIELVFKAYNEGRVRDTMIRELLLALATGEAVRKANKSYSLAALVEKYLDKDISDTKGEDAWRLRYSELSYIPLDEWPQEAIDYPLADATHTMQVFAHQHKHKKYFEANELAQTRAAWDLHLLSCNCPKVNAENVEKFKAMHQSTYEAACAPLIRAKVLKPNPNRHKEFPTGDPRREGYSMDTKLLKKLIQADYTKQGRVVPATAKGDISTSGETLLGCQTKVLKKYGEAAGAKKMIEGFIPGVERALASPDKRITTRYGVIMKTGRTGSSKVNLQNVSKEKGARECFEAPEGKVFVSIDYSSMEVFTLAQNMFWKYGNRLLLDAVNEDDPHLIIAAETMGIDLEEARKLKEADDEIFLKYRAFGKVQNFGYGGGMGADTTLASMDSYIQEMLGQLYAGQHLPTVIKDSIKDWKDKWGLHKHFNRVSRLCNGGTKPTYTCPMVGRIKALNSYCQFCNMHFQPLAADAMKEAMALVQESVWIPGNALYEHDVEFMVEIHDEFLMAGPANTMPTWVPMVQEMMVRGASKVLPDCKLRTEAEVSGKFWSKKGVSVVEYLEQLEN